jgi:iron complex transport system ATP-binding protein
MGGYTNAPHGKRAKSQVRRPSEASFLGGDAVEGDPALLAREVSVRYPSAPRPALERVSLSVEAGKIAALLGPNGSGKSTLLRVAAGIVPASAGQVRIFGQSVEKFDRQLLARAVAFVPQTETVTLGFTVREVVAMGRAPHQDGWMRERQEDRAVVEAAVHRCDLAGLQGRRVEELSGGEQRRVAVARALAQRPRLLLLDEPAAFLDVRHRMDLYDLLEEIAKIDHVACVIAMHELDAAARVASQALLLREGRVIAAGAPDDVMIPERLREAFDAEIDTSVHAPTGQRYFVTRRDRSLKP